MVGPGRDVANIVDISSLKVKLSIPEEEIGKIQTQQEAELTVDTAPDRIIHGRVYSVGSKTETPIGHTYPVEVIVKNEGIDFLRVGMFARVKISVEVASDALTISKESILNEDVHPQVFIVDNNIARLRSIKLGIRSGDQVQVIEGLRLSEAVISFGQKGLKDGTPVQPK
jgi:RND family efflux transporter MFP subunit